MSLTKFTGNINVISQLDDTPTQSGDALKAKFDEAGNSIKDYLNNTLTTETEQLVASEKASLQQIISNLNTQINQSLSQLSENMKTKIITGQEIATNEYIDDKRVYMKRINCGSFPNKSSKNISTNLNINDVTICKPLTGFAYGIVNNDTFILTLPDISPNYAQGATRLNLRAINSIYNIVITAGEDRSNFNGYVEVYYTKNND